MNKSVSRKQGTAARAAAAESNQARGADAAADPTQAIPNQAPEPTPAIDQAEAPARPEPCWHCGGTGFDGDDDHGPVVCPFCFGAGRDGGPIAHVVEPTPEPESSDGPQRPAGLDSRPVAAQTAPEATMDTPEDVETVEIDLSEDEYRELLQWRKERERRGAERRVYLPEPCEPEPIITRAVEVNDDENGGRYVGYRACLDGDVATVGFLVFADGHVEGVGIWDRPGYSSFSPYETISPRQAALLSKALDLAANEAAAINARNGYRPA